MKSNRVMVLLASLGVVLIAGLAFWAWRSNPPGSDSATTGPAAARPNDIRPAAGIQSATPGRDIASASAPGAGPNANSSAGLGTARVPRMLGGGVAVRLDDIPAGSRLRSNLKALSPEARARALEQLTKISFPIEDIASLHVNVRGEVFYVCDQPRPARPPSPQPAAAMYEGQPAAPSMAAETVAPVSISSPPIRHSRPGATKVLYLDFNGHTLQNTAWNEAVVNPPRPAVAVYVALPFDTDGNPTTFSAEEQAAIIQTWERVAEDYAPFDVDVTTEEPAAITNFVARAIITKATDANGVSLPGTSGTSAVGVAHEGGYGDAGFAQWGSCCFVYFDRLPSAADYADVAAHELGHTMGLSHDGKLADGNQAATDYYFGHGTGELSWSPLMGGAATKSITQWSKGEYYLANNAQDDLAIIAGKLAYRPDDVGDTPATAAMAIVNGSVFSASGIIEKETDVDVFRFNTAAGAIAISATPFRATGSPNGGNLDIRLELLDSNGTTVAVADPADTATAQLSTTVASGSFYLCVLPVGTGTPLANPPTGYTRYGSIGHYTITGSIIAAAPSITSAATATGHPGEAFNYGVVATNSPTSFGATGLPAGLALNPTTGVIGGTPTVTGTFAVTLTATNSIGTGNLTLTLTVSAVAPAITTHPATQVVQVGNSPTLSVTVTGTAPLSYEWKKDGVTIAGATNSSLVLANVQPAGAGSYTVVVSNVAGSVTSNAATITVRIPPAITTQPIGAIAAVGQTVSFAVVATGLPAPTYVWRKNGTAIAGATNATLSLTNIQAVDAGVYSVVVNNSAGSVTSNAVTLTVIVPPLITAQPQSLTVAAGASATFSVSASGTDLGFQWRKDGADVGGATNSSYTIASVQSAHACNYEVLVWNGAGSVTSNMAALTIAATAPTITTQPQAQTVNAGAGVTFSVVASGYPAPTYQWQRNGTAITGATNASYTIASAQSADAGSYTVVVTNSAGSANSTAAALTVNSPPTITTQPQSLTVAVGATAIFPVVATGNPAPAYQWHKSGTAITGATNASYTISSTQSTDAGSYTVVVTNSAGSVTSNVATLTIASTAPTVTIHPVNQTVSIGQGASFAVTATGTAPIGYQWRKGGTAISGATGVSYTIVAAQITDAGSYDVVVSNAAGSVTSNAATLTVVAAPTITVHPISQVVQTGSSVAFNVSATGAAPLTYQWKKDGTALAGATNPSLVFLNVQPADAGSYAVVVTNSGGNVTSNAATLTANVPPSIDLDLWSARVTSPGNSLHAVAWSGSIFVAVGEAGTIVTSPDAVAWTTRNSGTTSALFSVCWNGSQFVVVGWDGTILTSPDGLVWTSRNLSVPRWLYGVAWGGNQFVAVGMGGAIYTSPDGAVWTIRSSGTTELLTGVVWSGDQFVAVGNNGAIVSSANGVDWVIRVSHTTEEFWSVTYGGGRFAAVGFNGTIRLSADGAQWTLGNSNTTQTLTSVAWTGGQFVAVGHGGTIRTYADGLLWTTRNSGTNNGLLGVMWSGSQVVVVGGGGQILTAGGVAATAPSITTQPQTQTVNAGASVTFTVVASGNPAPTYQWQKNGAAISGATTAIFTLGSALSTDAGNYTVVASNSAGSVTSDTAVLTVVAPVTNNQSLTGLADALGGTKVYKLAVPTGQTQLSIRLTGGTGNADVYARLGAAPSLSQYDHRANTAGSEETITITNPAAGDWYVMVYAAFAYSGATLTTQYFTDAAPTVTTHPQSQTVMAGASVTFTVVVTVNSTPTYQWQKNGTAIVGGTLNTLYLPVVAAADAGSYTCVITNSAGNVTSGAAVLTVNADTSPAFYTFSTLAGYAGYGSTDGTGSAARFWNPSGVSVDSAGNVYVADQYNHTIRKITSGGVVTTLAGTADSLGTTDGTGSAGRFYYPTGVSVDSAGNVYVADRDNNTIRKITSGGVVTTLAGFAYGSGTTDGTGSAARFNNPTGVSVDSAGNIYVADQANQTIRRITSAGVVTTLAGTAGSVGATDGTGSAARFNYPTGVSVDSAGNVYVADRNNATIRKITSAGVVTTLAGAAGSVGATDGAGSAARFNSPTGVSVDSAGNVYVADSSNQAIRKITSAGVVTTLAGTAGSVGAIDGTGTAAMFKYPSGVTVDSAGNVYVADQYNSTIRKITSGGAVTTLAGTAGSVGVTDGTGSAARFNYPTSVSVDSASSVYVADSSNHTIRKITGAGVVTTLAGTAGVDGSTDGTGGAARFCVPTGVSVDGVGNVYVADQYNNTIRKITGAGVVTTLAGSAGIWGATDGMGSVARFNYPQGVSVDSAGNVYVADTYNHTIRKITSAGVVTTLAGTAGSAGATDGAGSAARFNHPKGVSVDSAGNVYVADSHNQTIRKITSAGVVATLAGSAGSVGATDGTGSAARFSYPTGVTVDTVGNVYVADRDNNKIRKITSEGVVTTLAGLAGYAGAADGTGSAARFYYPEGVSVDSAGNVYVGDTSNNTIRKGVPATAPVIITQPQSQTVTAGTSATLSVVATGAAPLSYQWKKNGVAISGATNATLTLANLAVADAGSYICVVTSVAGSVTSNVATLTVNVAPAITTHPQSQTVAGGTSVMFSLTATGTPTPTYQWRKDGTAISGATNSIYTIASAQTTDAGSYTVIVINTAGSVTSNAATLTVLTPTTVTSYQPVIGLAAAQGAQSLYRITVPMGQAQLVIRLTGGTGNADLYARLGAAPSLSQYDYRANASGNDETITITNPAAGDWYVMIYAAATYTGAALTTQYSTATAPVITAQPQSVTVVAGLPTTFSVTATGTPAPTYQWKKNGDDIAGATMNSLYLPLVSASDAGSYTVVATNSGGSVTSSAAVLTVSPAPNLDLDKWTWRNPLPQGNPLNAVAWSGNQFVAMSDSGTILTSPDGVTWTVRTAGTTNAFWGVTWSGSQFVAVGESGAILTSPDGVTWTARTSGTTCRLSGVTWGGGQFVAVGYAGTILTSSDGVIWTNRTLGTTYWLFDVIWGGSQFVAVGESGAILTSPDGVTWTARTSGTTNYLRGATWSGSQFVAVGESGATLTSPDGVTWTARTSDTTSGLYAVTWGGSQFVVVGESGTILTSPDGITWNGRTSGTVYYYLSDVTRSDSQFVAVGFGGMILTSPDGVTWTAGTSGTSNQFNSVVRGGSQFVAVGGRWWTSGTILTSADGVSWTSRTLGTANCLTSVTWNGSQFVVVGNSGTILTSADGVTWTSRTSGTAYGLSGVTWGGSQFVAVGESGAILTSADGVTWTSRTSGTAYGLSGVTWGGGQFVVVGGSSTILTSPDGITWTNRTSGATNFLCGVTWSGSQFVAVGYAGTILTSSDGVTWTNRTSGPTNDLRDVTWGGGQFVAVGYAGTILTSSDGVTWTNRTFGTTYWLFDVIWGGSQFVAVGESGAILTASDPLVLVAPLITTHPQTQSVTAGASATFSVVATGTPTPTYQWQKNGIAITGATNATITLANVQSSDAGSYACVVTNPAASATSDPATLTVLTPTTVTNNQPVTGLTAVQGAQSLYRISMPVGQVQLAIRLTGGTGNADVYARLGTAPSLSQYDYRANATGNEETITIANPAAGDWYFSVYAAAAYSGATLTTQFSAAGVAPTITAQAQSQAVTAGQSVTFTVVATGSPNPTYQWNFNGSAIAGATNATLILSNVQAANAGSYTVTVSNNFGVVTSNAVTLSGSNPAPTITTQPQNFNVTAGHPATLSVTATGTGSLTYQWRRNGYAVAEATNASYTLASASRSDADIYDVVVADGLSTTVSTRARMSVAPTSYPGAVAFDRSAAILLEDANSSSVQSVVVLPGGKSLAAGNFNSVDGQRRTGLARFNADGTLDTAFIPPEFNGRIYSIAVQIDGKILACGWFTQVGGHAHRYLARLNADGTLDHGFDLNVESGVEVMAAQTNGKIVLCGSFNSVGGQTRNQVARLNADGSLDTGFASPTIGGGVSRVAVQTDGKVVLGGWIANVGGVTRNGIARLNADGTLDTAFDPNANSQMEALAVQPDGKILVGGFFSSVGGQPRSYIARLNTDGTVDPDFNPGADRGVTSLAVQPDGKILVGGFFYNVGGQARSNIARLNADGTIDAVFNPTSSGAVHSFALPGDGTILIGGSLMSVGGQARSRLAKLNADGTLNSAVAPTLRAAGTVGTLAHAPGGKVYAGGRFTHANGVPCSSNLARFNTDGSLDGAFNPRLSGRVNALAVQGDGKLLVGGGWGSIDGVTGSVGRLNSNGTLDTGFNPNVGDGTLALAVQPDGRILVGGWFGSISGQSRNRLARLNPDGTLDAGFNPDVGGQVSVLAVQPNGQILFGGQFASVDGQARNCLVRVNANGTLDTGFTSGLANSDSLYALFLQTDGKIVVGGYFNMIGGQSRGHIARLNADGTVDAGFATSNGFNNRVDAILPQEDGRILVGGNFDWFAGAANTARVARLNVDGTSDTVFQFVAGLVSFQPAQALLLTDSGRLWVGGAEDYGFSLARLVPAAAPAITGQPAHQTANAGATVTFSVIASGSPTPAYQWNFNGVAVPGATNATLTLANVARTNIGNYSVTVSNGFGSVASNSVALGSADPAPTTTMQPQNVSVTAGATATFGVTATGTGTLAYQWRRNGFNVPGATNASYTTTATRGLEGMFDVLVENGLSTAVSAGAFMSVAPAKNFDLLTAELGFGPRLESSLRGSVSAWLPMADGRILVGGEFSSVGGVVRSRLAVLQATGAPDATFTPPALDGSVSLLVPQPDGKILVGGSFKQVDGRLAGGLFRLTLALAVDPAFDVGLGFESGGNTFSVSAPRTAAVQADGKIVVGGDFTRVAGQSRPYLARLNANGSPDTAFAPPVLTASSGTVTIMGVRVEIDGRIVVAGNFTGGIARLLAGGGLDPVFNAGSGANATVFAVAPSPGGKWVIAGRFTSYNGTSAVSLARLGVDGTLDPTFTVASPPGFAPFDVSRTGLYVDATGRVYLGSFYLPLRRYSASGAEDPIANLPSILSVNSLIARTDGSLFVCGDNYSNRTSYSCFTIDANDSATAETTLDLRGWAVVNQIEQLPDGRLLVAGDFTHVGGAARNHLAMLNADGSLDTLFDANRPRQSNAGSARFIRWSDGTLFFYDGATIVRLTAAGGVAAGFAPVQGNKDFAVDRSGRIYLAILNYNDGVWSAGISRFLPDGTADATYVAPSLSGSVAFPAVVGEGAVYVAAQGNEGIAIGGAARALLARLDNNGGLDASFNCPMLGSSASPFTAPLVRLPNGQVLVGRGSGYPFPNEPTLLRLSSSGSIDASYATLFGNSDTSGLYTTMPATSAIIALPDGRVIRGGGGLSRHLAGTGARDTTFTTSTEYTVNSMVLRDDGRFVVASGTAGERGGMLLLGPVPAVPVAIVSQPAAQTASAGATVTFSVVATGTPAPMYQWRKGGTPIAGATSAALTLTNVLPADVGSYDVAVANSAGSVTSNTVTLTVNPAPDIDLDKWTWRNPLPQGNTLNAVTWGGDRLVAVGAVGTIMTSPDGAVWTGRTSGTTSSLTGLTWTGSQYVAVGEKGTILTSTDGGVWTNRTSGTTNGLNGVIWTGSQLVAVGLSGTILTSSDGVAWTSRSSGTVNSLNGVAWAGNQLIAVGGDYGSGGPTILTSPDGVAWTSRASDSVGYLSGVMWNGNQIVAVGSQNGGFADKILTSPDGVTWIDRSTGASCGLYSVVWNGSQFVAVGGPYGAVLTSPDGVTWTRRNGIIDNWLLAVVWTAGQFVAVGGGGAILTSADGGTWTSRSSGAERYSSFVGMSTDGTAWVGVDSWGRIATSGDGVVWESRNTSPNYCNAVTRGTNLFVAVGRNGVILSSEDAVTWANRTSGTTNDLLGVTWNRYVFVAVGRAGTVLTSTDGIAWTSRASGTTNDLNGIAWSGNQFVAVGYGGTILTSADGVVWTSRISGTGTPLYGATWATGRFVVVGDGGVILTSDDGATWRSRISGTTTALMGVVWAGSQFVAVGEGGTVLSSWDGAGWSSRISVTNNRLNAVAWNGRQFVAVGWSGTILTASTPAVAAVPRITTQPAGDSITAGQSAMFTVVALATPAPTYQWRKGGVNLAGATNATLLLTNVQATDGGSYDVVVTNAAGSVVSNLATLSVRVGPDLDHWAIRSAGTTEHLSGVTWNGRMFVAVGSAGSILTSADGVAWTTRAAGTTNGLHHVTGSANQFVAVGEYGTILTSADGIAWTSRSSGTTNSLSGAVWSGSQFVVVGNFGTILTSSDGLSWASRSSGTTNWLFGITWNGSQFAAVGNGGTILTSPDATSWTTRTTNTTTGLYNITWGGSQFVATGAYIILTSPNGETWTRAERYYDFYEYLRGVVWDGSWFVMVGGPGVVLSSPTGVSWTAHNSGSTGMLSGVAWSGSQFVAVGNGGLILTAGAEAVSVPVVVAQPPAAKFAGIETGTTLSVTAIGTGTLNYQWKKDGVVLVDGGRISGATTATLSLASLTLADAGNYTVVVTNAAGSVTSGAALLTIVDARATHAVIGAGYTAGGTVTLTQTLAYSGACTGITWQMLLPAGWSYASDGGSAGESKPAVGTTSLLEWTWNAVPVSPVTFTVTLNVPAGATGGKTISSLAIVRVAAGPADILVKPDPLTVAPGTTHSADPDKNLRISLLELTRVIELYNTRNGTIRTGCYNVQLGTEDGFTQDPTRAGTAVVTLTVHHSADSDRNGKLSLLELTRVIELYNYRSGTVRTGQYHVQTGTEDGFGPGP